MQQDKNNTSINTFCSTKTEDLDLSMFDPHHEDSESRRESIVQSLLYEMQEEARYQEYLKSLP